MVPKEQADAVVIPIPKMDDESIKLIQSFHQNMQARFRLKEINVLKRLGHACCVTPMLINLHAYLAMECMCQWQ